MIRLLVLGASGRVGSAVAALAQKDSRFKLAGCLHNSRPLPPGLPAVTGEALQRAAAEADVLIDFTLPAPSLAHARLAASVGRPIVIGTTGFSDAQLRALKSLTRRLPLFLSPNMSLAMNVLFELAREAQLRLRGYDAALVEAHHAGKRDAPSGTALRLQKLLGLSDGRIVSVRAGGIVGDHTLILAGQHERLELTHRAQSREAFAQGALEAAAWMKRKEPGLYAFSDLLLER